MTDESPSQGDTTSGVVIDNKLAANKLAANKLAANKLAANKLAANRLAANRLRLNPIGAGDLITTPEGREVLSFIISCALAEGTTLVGEHAGTTFEFFGELGLARRWEDRRLDRRGAGWVSACLFARVNAANVVIPISLRGSTRALATTPDERANWSLQEGGFYGNFFTRDDEPIEWIACRGEDQAAGETGGLIERDCAEPDPQNPGRTLCGFEFAGDCGDFARRFACRRFDERGTFYSGCRDEAVFRRDRHHRSGGGGHDDDDDDDDHDHDHDDDDDCNGHRRTFHEVITTYVIP